MKYVIKIVNFNFFIVIDRYHVDSDFYLEITYFEYNITKQIVIFLT